MVNNSSTRHAIHIDDLNGNGFAVSRCVCFQAVFRRKIVQKSYRFLYTIFEYIMFFMLLSQCGEYMANGLTNAVRHEFVIIANDRQAFVSVRKHSRSFLWCFECYAGLTSGECMENGLTNAIRHPFAMIAK